MSSLLSMHCRLLFVLLVLSGFSYVATYSLNHEIDAYGNCYWLMTCKFDQLHKIQECFEGLENYPEICETITDGMRILASELKFSCADILKHEFVEKFRNITCNLDDEEKSKRMRECEPKSIIYQSLICNDPFKYKLCDALMKFFDKFRNLYEEHFSNGNCPI